MRRALLLILLAACKRAGRHAAPAPADKPVSELDQLAKAVQERAPKVRAALRPDRLSVFLPYKSLCDWMSVDPSGTKPPLLLLPIPGSCNGISVGFSPDHERALVWLADPTDDAKQALWLADIVGAETAGLPLPPYGRLDTIGYDATGVPIALTENPVGDPQHDTHGSFLSFQGQRFPVSGGEGTPIMVHAFRLIDRRWQLAESRASTTGADYSAGTSLLALATQLCARSADILTPHPDGDEVTAPAELGALKSFAPDLVVGEAGAWLKLPGTPAVFVWQVNAEFMWATGRIAVARGGKLEALGHLDFGKDNVVSVTRRGKYLLVSTRGDRPSLFDLTDGRLVWSSEVAHTVTFWPEPACATRP